MRIHQWISARISKIILAFVLAFSGAWLGFQSSYTFAESNTATGASALNASARLRFTVINSGFLSLITFNSIFRRVQAVTVTLRIAR